MSFAVGYRQPNSATESNFRHFGGFGFSIVSVSTLISTATTTTSRHREGLEVCKAGQIELIVPFTMSFLGIRSLHASCSRSIINHVLVQVQPPRQHSLPLVSKTILSRHFTGTGLHSQRQVLGRITPKRIAIPFTPGSTSGNSDIPHASIWRPILVRHVSPRSEINVLGVLLMGLN